VTIYAHTDGASRGNPGESGIGIVLHDEKGTVLYSGSGYIGKTTNNVAEYEALLACLRKVRSLDCRKLVVYSDSELMVRQIRGEYKVKDKALRVYFGKVRELITAGGYEFSIQHITREQNADADLLANAGIDNRKALALA